MPSNWNMLREGADKRELKKHLDLAMSELTTALLFCDKNTEEKIEEIRDKLRLLQQRA